MTGATQGTAQQRHRCGHRSTVSQAGIGTGERFGQCHDVVDAPVHIEVTFDISLAQCVQ